MSVLNSSKMRRRFANPAFTPAIPLISSWQGSFTPHRVAKCKPSVAPCSHRGVWRMTEVFSSADHMKETKSTSEVTPLKVSREPRLSSTIIRVASARAISPIRRRSESESQGDRFTEMESLPSQRRSDLMAPKTVGFWSFIPYMAATAVMFGIAFLAKKRFVARQARLVEEFGQVLVMYGTNPESKLEITSDYKRKIGPGILRGAMFASFLSSLIEEKAVLPSTIQEVFLIKKLLRIGDAKAVAAINKLAATLNKSPSLLGKLLFISERIVSTENALLLELVPLFPYSESTVADLQQNMLERCYWDFVTNEIELNSIEDPPMVEASALRLDEADARLIFEDAISERAESRKAEAAKAAAAEAEAANAASVESEETSKSEAPDLDYPARSGEPAKAAVHAYQCTDCGYTLFPAAGREFKFYGDDFVCPACKAPKDKFVDINADE